MKKTNLTQSGATDTLRLDADAVKPVTKPAGAELTAKSGVITLANPETAKVNKIKVIATAVLLSLATACGQAFTSGTSQPDGGVAGGGGAGAQAGGPVGGGNTGGLDGGNGGTGGQAGGPVGGGGNANCGPVNATIEAAPDTKYDFVWFRGDNIIQDSLANGTDELSSINLNGVEAGDTVLVQVKPNNMSGEFGGIYNMPSCGLTVDARGLATDVTAASAEFLNVKNTTSGWTTPPDSDPDPGDFNGEFIGVSPYDKSTIYRYTILQTN